MKIEENVTNIYKGNIVKIMLSGVIGNLKIAIKNVCDTQGSDIDSDYIFNILKIIYNFQKLKIQLKVIQIMF